MRLWITRKRLGWLTASAAAVLVLLDAFGTPVPHDIHSPGAIPIAVHISEPVSPIGPFDFAPKVPSESLADVRCQEWHEDPRNQRRGDPCPDDATLALSYVPQLKQTPQTLYVGWQSCGTTWYWEGSGQQVYYGLNVEYLGSTRTLILHCYSAEAWIHGQGPPGTNAMGPAMTLLLVPTSAISPGKLSIVEEDRIEHMVGDQVSEVPIVTATIS